MKRSVGLSLLAVSLVLVGAPSAQAQGMHRIGGGVEYLRTLGDIKDAPEFDANALGFVASYQYVTNPFRIEGDLELIPDFGGTDEMLFAPQAYLLVGGLIYGGVGIGAGYFDGDWLSDPFYALRGGVDLPLGVFDLDAFALYRFHDAAILKDLDESDLDSITFGALIRFHIGD